MISDRSSTSMSVYFRVDCSKMEKNDETCGEYMMISNGVKMGILFLNQPSEIAAIWCSARSQPELECLWWNRFAQTGHHGHILDMSWSLLLSWLVWETFWGSKWHDDASHDVFWYAGVFVLRSRIKEDSMKIHEAEHEAFHEAFEWFWMINFRHWLGSVS